MTPFDLRLGRILQFTVSFVAFSFLVSCNSANSAKILNYSDLLNYTEQRWEQDSSVLVMAGNGEMPSRELTLDKGKYILQFKAMGTSSSNGKPHFVISFRDYKLADLDIETGIKEYAIPFELPRETKGSVAFKFDNDYSDSTGDRNIFLNFPVRISPF